MIRFSIIVPVYKVKREHLDQCVQSVLGQTFGDLELILVDDGSPDDCGRYCDEYAQKDPRVKVVHKENGGTASARNAGLLQVTGEWVTFIDSDDWFESDSFERLNRAVETYHCADIVMFSGMREFNNNTENIPINYSDGQQFSSHEEREQLQMRVLAVAKEIHHSSINLVSACAKLYRRSYMVDNNLMFDSMIRYNEDGLFSLETIEKANLIVNVKESLYHYRSTEDSKVNKFRPNVDSEQTLLINRIIEFADKNKKRNGFRHAIMLRCIVSIQLCFFQKYYHSEYNRNNRRKNFIAFLGSEPFITALKSVNTKELNSRFKFKFICYKYRLFGLLSLTQRLYIKLTGKH